MVLLKCDHKETVTFQVLPRKVKMFDQRAQGDLVLLREKLTKMIWVTSFSYKRGLYTLPWAVSLRNSSTWFTWAEAEGWVLISLITRNPSASSVRRWDLTQKHFSIGLRIHCSVLTFFLQVKQALCLLEGTDSFLSFWPYSFNEDFWLRFGESYFCPKWRNRNQV